MTQRRNELDAGYDIRARAEDAGGKLPAYPSQSGQQALSLGQGIHDRLCRRDRIRLLAIKQNQVKEFGYEFWEEVEA